MGWQSQALGSQAADAAAQSWTRPPGRAHGVRVLARGPPSSREEGRDARSVESATVQRGIGVACAASSARPCSLLHIVHTTPCCCRSPSRRVQDGSSNRNGCQALGGRRAPRPRVPLACPSWGWRGVCFSLPCLPGLALSGWCWLGTVEPGGRQPGGWIRPRSQRCRLGLTATPWWLSRCWWG